MKYIWGGEEEEEREEEEDEEGWLDIQTDSRGYI